jgi:very-short-patch-repair endonuclease
VVTGPPGTGKSQVVVSILANAYLRGQRVLFSSRNHKAIDVVETRINGFSDTPLVIRLGTKSGERDLRKELVNFVSQVLSLGVTDEDRRLYKEAEDTYRTLLQRRDSIWTRLESARTAQHRVAQADKGLETYRDRLRPDIFSVLFQRHDASSAGQVAEAVAIVQAHLTATRLFDRIKLWIRRGGDAQKVLLAVQPFRKEAVVFGELPKDLTGKEDWQPWLAPLQELQLRLAAHHQCREYHDALEGLKQSVAREELATEFQEVEEHLWEWGAHLIAARSRLLSERLTPDTRRALGQFRATLERISSDEVGGKAYYDLKRELERLFSIVSDVLPLWCVTNQSVRNALPFYSGVFDLVIIDEASQCDIPSAMPMLYRAKRAIIIGDPQQLRHVTSMDRHQGQLLANKHNLNTAADQPYTYPTNSLFDLAATCAGNAKVISLREHFRSHPDITGFSSKTWYQGTLKICTDFRKLKCPNGASPGIKWTQVSGKAFRPTGGGTLIQEEARAAVAELEGLIEKGFQGTVGIVTPFRAQANRIRDLVNEKLDLGQLERLDLIVDTAHGFQGDERDVIIFSPCVSRDLAPGSKYFLSATGNLFNVAITRARALLHIVGDAQACAESGIKHVEDFARYVATLGDGERGARQTNWKDPHIGFWEKPFFDALVAAGLRPNSQYVVHQYRLDLALVEGETKLDIEVDGEEFHKEMDGERCYQDLIRDARLMALGWQLKRFWVYRLRDEMPKCVREVNELWQRLRVSRQRVS